MLAKLEMDEDFMKLSDNEQIAWLESLFFLDTPSKKASSGLVKPRPREEINQNSRRPSTLPASKVDTSSISSVSSKSLSIQSNSGRTPTSTREQQQANTNANFANATSTAANDTEEVDNCPPGLNKDKCALAMSFFNNDSKGAKKPSAKKTSKSSSTNGNANDLPNVTNAVAKPFAKSSPPERAYYEPDADLLPEDDEEEDLEEVFQTRVNSRKNRQPPELEHAPPVPERSGEPKAMMMRLMKNATNIMRS